MKVTFVPWNTWTGPHPLKGVAERQTSTFSPLLAHTVKALQRELAHLNCTHLVYSMNLPPEEFHPGYWPSLTAMHITSPGVCVTAWCGSKTYHFCCDTYRTWSHNLHAISLTLIALRTAGRHGVFPDSGPDRLLSDFMIGKVPIPTMDEVDWVDSSNIDPWEIWKPKRAKANKNGSQPQGGTKAPPPPPPPPKAPESDWPIIPKTAAQACVVMHALTGFHLNETTPSEADLVAAYREGARRHHPDVLGGCHQKFVSLSAAYQFLLRRAK